MKGLFRDEIVSEEKRDARDKYLERDVAPVLRQTPPSSTTTFVFLERNKTKRGGQTINIDGKVP